ncbi:hydroxyethylthiazole kinase [Natronococcus pandeyae]|uniref:Hydroxyethylthiazole kinase n=1 Tax=Natronococcus pandeyae TaxID=2055836 RepID=A0A8J8Q688_9EURY|nr:hydroxyethylthiazole kinase [Natronococcus pandeyae]TYL39827.1 hydroxyethylthiazole kinase [Natronococcus pandeyae]
MSSIDTNGSSLEDSLRTLADTGPLVQHLTNEVTMNDVANLTLHWDALPVMADSPGDAGEMAELASALLLNIGQVPERKVEAMHEAAETANDRGIPVVLDPVGVGSTPTREGVAEALLSETEFAVIKGNYGEISALAGVEAEVKGVESIGEYDEIEETARSVAESTGAVVVASGVEDVVADADRATRITAGHERLGEVVGTGCMLGATIAGFCGALEDPYTAALHATLAFGLAGERAAELPHEGPASYRTNFHDAVAGFSPDVAAEFEPEDRLERVD